MRKYLFFIILFSLILQGIFDKTYTYQNFDGRYGYSDLNSSSNTINISSDSDEEVLFIMDFSGSMNKKMGYTPKSFLAIDAIRDILDEVGTSAKIGLRIFGITDKPSVERRGNKLVLNKEVLCTASSLVLPVARYNSANISDKLSKYNPQGATPIGYSLRQAVQMDFSRNAPLKHIILITDGNENCGDDPCLYIKNLMELRNDYKIDVIGITVDQNAYSQLKCIANAGKGSYYSVNSPDDFRLKFMQALKSTQPIQQKMQPVVITKPRQIDDGTIYKNYTFQFYN